MSDNSSPREQLDLSPDEMRELGYRVVDRLVDHLETLPDQSAGRQARRKEMEEQFNEPLPMEGEDPIEVLEQATEEILSYAMRPNHPRFFGFIPSPSNFVSVMADALASGFNPFLGMWMEAAGPSQIELTTIDWLRELCGLPDKAGGLFTSGGSAANLTALCAAREVMLTPDQVHDAVIYFSDQTHSSIDRALRILGFQPDQIRRLPSDDHFRLDLEALQTAIIDDRAAGRHPFCVVANPGTTNTGAVDPLAQIAELCEREELWMHADGAYGTAAVLCEEGRAKLDGIGRAHSLSFDPHKWLFQPFEIGCVLTRNRRWLRDTFRVLPEYLEDIDMDEEEVNFADHGLQLTRNFRALKLWMSLKVFGASAFADAVQHGFDMARTAEQIIRDRPDWSLVTPAQMGILTFRYKPEDLPESSIESLNHQLVSAIFEDSWALTSSTKLRGSTVLRFCPINPRTTENHIRETIDHFGKLARRCHRELDAASAGQQA